MKDKTLKASAEIKKMEHIIRSFANAAIHATNAISEFSSYLNEIEAIKVERKRKQRQFRINWIKYYILFGWVKELNLKIR